MKQKLRSNTVLHLLLLVVLGVIAYSNTFHAPFVFDDQSSITQNPVIRNLGNFLLSSKGYSYNPRRFVGYLTFALNYRWGGMDVMGFHLVNLAIHLLNGLLAYALVRSSFRTPFMRSSALAERAHWVALLTAALFILHPIQTEAVTYIVQRLSSLTTTFYLLAFFLYLEARLRSEEGETREERRKRRTIFLLYAGSILAAILAMKTKEIAFTLPLQLTLFDFFFFRGSGRKRMLFLIPVLLTLLIIPLSLLNLHRPVGQVISDVTKVTSVQPTTSRWGYLVTQFCVITTYVRLLFCPVHQNLDYDYPIYHSLFSPRPFFCFLFLLALFGLAVYLSVRARRGDPALRFIGFGILWFSLALSVTSSFIPITDVIFEHRLYLPSFGAFVAVATVLILWGTKIRTTRWVHAATTATMAVVLALGIATFMRNEVWGSKVSLWRDAMTKSQGKVRPYNNLGAALSDAGRPDEAIAVLSRALEVDPEHAEAYYNLGRVYLSAKNDPGRAIALLRRAIALRPTYDDAYINLAGALNRTRRFGEAARLLEEKIPNFEDRADAHFNLAVSLIYLGQMKPAERQYQIVRQLDPKLAATLTPYFQ